jgi:hypothetical protein
MAESHQKKSEDSRRVFLYHLWRKMDGERGNNCAYCRYQLVTFCHLNVTKKGYFKTKKRVDLDRWGVIKRREGKNLTRPDLTVQKRKREEVEL